jgi:hypothetical protein
MTDVQAVDDVDLAGEACRLLADALKALDAAGLTTAAAMASAALDEALARVAITPSST